MILLIQRALFAFLLFGMFSYSLHAQQVEEKQMSLVVKKTATWCPNCGSWGWQWFKELIGDTENDAFAIALHSTNSQLKPPMDLDGSILAQFTGNGGFPTFFVNGASYSTYDGLINAVELAASQDPIAGLGMQTGYDNGEIACHGKVDFFQPFNGEVYVGYYIIEDSLVFDQSAQGPNAIHRFVLRDAMESKPFGNGMDVDVQVGESVYFSSVQTYPSNALDRLSILGVIWTYANGKYTHLNSWMEPVAEGPISGLDQNSFFSETKVFPNPVATGQKVILDLPDGIKGIVNVQVIQSDGRIVKSFVIHEGLNQDILLPSSLVPGSYFIRIEQGPNSATLPLTINK